MVFVRKQELLGIVFVIVVNKRINLPIQFSLSPMSFNIGTYSQL